MKLVLSINAGSSSLKCQVLRMPEENVLLKIHVDGIGQKLSQINVKAGMHTFSRRQKVTNHFAALKLAFSLMQDCDIITVDAIGHRVVHGGEYYDHCVRINKSVLAHIKTLEDLAPLHNPPNLAGIKASRQLLPKTPQFAIFDTAFHHSIPQHAFLYGLPLSLYHKYGIRKYGFHGTAHKYLNAVASKKLKKKSTKIITCHLGNGSSITAVKNGRSVDTTMGFSPLDGLIMGTRSGDLDPEIPLFLMDEGHYSLKELQHLLNHESGLKGLTGHSDLRDVYHDALHGDKKAGLAIEMLSYRLANLISGLVASMNGVDAIVFSGGIGENAWYVRKWVGEALSFLGVKLDYQKNHENKEVISTKHSKIKLYVIPANEELQIAREVYTALK